ncbi:MAG: 16S rRNA (adenine(1518)-N(6)/adenine(1519)-N(6))-dimethyltransferase RsmA [Mycoplasmataceae bacterium]|jgi:16S rRNA (adenine1518-N6/adenine1519-N6)-dimethyltransferase|nr:16S rRNA (adenine(1518)-N(6)/adenine(1519)-N(6))-dimethyltransferase RsmA [Mycoplasmataceae bacterium]
MDIEVSAKQFIKSNNFNPSKKMGQNFLINEKICKNLVDSINFTNVDLIIEIGPGLGAITKYLNMHNVPITAIELDKRLSEFVHTKFTNINLINNDVLKVDFNELTAKYSSPIIVSNLPYSISSIVVIKFVKSNIKTMYCMLQKEMVLRLLAKKSTHEYNAFTVLLQTYANIKKITDVSKSNFLPPPNVDSIFIVIEKNNLTYDEKYDKFVRQCFLSKRRTLVNNLKDIVDKNKLINFLNDNKLSLSVRAEELDIKQFQNLFNAITE